MGISSSPNPSMAMRILESRKKEKKDLDENQLREDLWGRLPECLIQQVLANLPFSSLFRFCCVCKSWRESILSCRPLLVFVHMGNLIVHNAYRGAWEFVPLSFLPVEQHKSLSLVASAGGLLCFRTRFVDEFIVCNPLTKSYKRLQMPWKDAPLGDKYVTMPAALREFHRTKTMPRFFLVGMILNTDARHFKLIVASGVICVRRTTLVYDSCSDSWTRVDAIPEAASGGFQRAQPIVCSGNLYTTLRTSNNEIKLLKFDGQEQKWSSIQISTMKDLPWKLLEHNGKILLLTGDPENPRGFTFFELQDSGLTSWPSSKSLPLISLLEAMQLGSRDFDNLKILDCLGQGDDMFFIGSKTSTSRESRFGSLKLLRAGVHSFVTNSDVLSDWEEKQLGGCQSFPRFWQIFKPSLLSCN